MRDAIERGGYRAALEYYDSDDAEKSEAPWHWLRAKGWLLGRLGLYNRMGGGLLEEIAACPDFDHISTVGISGRPLAYRTPPLWLKTPELAGRNTGRLLTVESATADGRPSAVRPTTFGPPC